MTGLIKRRGLSTCFSCQSYDEMLTQVKDSAALSPSIPVLPGNFCTISWIISQRPVKCDKNRPFPLRRLPRHNNHNKRTTAIMAFNTCSLHLRLCDKSILSIHSNCLSREILKNDYQDFSFECPPSLLSFSLGSP